MNNTITEYYFGSELEPIEILKTKYGKVYVCKSDSEYVFYNEKGNDPMWLSLINTDKFEECLKGQK